MALPVYFNPQLHAAQQLRHANLDPDTHLTSQILRPINDLTRGASIPGEVQYMEYAQYLKDLGHVKGESSTTIGPGNPRNSILQADRGDRNDNKMDFRAEQALWTMDNLPAVLYLFGRPLHWLSSKQLKEPPLKPYPIYGERLRDIPILPDHISGELEGWRYEAWVRLDPRIGYADIEARMPPADRAMHKSRIQMRAKRFRDNFPLHGWVTRGKNFDVDRQRLVFQMQKKGIDLRKNNTRGLSWGLIDCKLGEVGGRINVPESQRQQPFVDTTTANITPLPCTIPPAFTTPNSVGAVFPTNSVLSTIAYSMPIHNPYTTAPESTNLQGPMKQLFVSHEGHSQNPEQSRSCAEICETPQGSELHASNAFKKEEGLSHASFPPDRIVLQHEGHILILKTAEERAHYSEETSALLATWHPAYSEGRLRQLEWVLDPDRAVNGFWDNHYRKPDSPYDMAANCTDQDIVYNDEALPEQKDTSCTVQLR